MTAEQLVNEYKNLPRDCYNVNYSDESAIKKNNAAVKRMVKIVQTLQKQFGSNGISKLKPLLDIDDWRTNLWVATHLLEKATLDDETENKALAIIESFANSDDIQAASYRQWLNRRKNGFGSGS
jgi:hypothetical protein